MGHLVEIGDRCSLAVAMVLSIANLRTRKSH